MAAPRSIQFIALRNLARHGSHQQLRRLHMTEPTAYASPALTKERAVLNLPTDIAGLRAECKARRIDVSGSKQELIARLQADHLTHSRAFTSATAQSKRPSAAERADTDAATAVRTFNTSRAHKAVNDTSTIDFAFLPNLNIEEADDAMRVPLLHNNYNPDRTGVHSDEAISEPLVVVKPMISTMSADSVFLPMSDLHDGHAMGIDFYAMADRVAANMRRMRVPVEEQSSMLKQLWNDLVDDMTNASKKVAA